MNKLAGWDWRIYRRKESAADRRKRKHAFNPGCQPCGGMDRHKEAGCGG